MCSIHVCLYGGLVAATLWAGVTGVLTDVPEAATLLVNSANAQAQSLDTFVAKEMRWPSNFEEINSVSSAHAHVTLPTRLTKLSFHQGVWTMPVPGNAVAHLNVSSDDRLCLATEKVFTEQKNRGAVVSGWALRCNVSGHQSRLVLAKLGL